MTRHSSIRRLVLSSPLSGWCAPLDEVPDPAFATRMLGDGVAIDPTDDVLRAPCDAEVVSVAGSSHAITLRTAEGVDVLLHVGIDTVALKGEGFEPLVAAGARVRRGEPLLRFDLASVAMRAPSLVTPMIVTGPPHATFEQPRCGTRVRAGDDVLVVAFERTSDPAPSPAVSGGPARRATTPTATTPTAIDTGSGDAVVRRARVALEHGVHARPAARLARLASEADVTLRARERVADARSVIGWMSLGLACGDEVELRSADPRAAAVVDALVEALECTAAEPAEAGGGATGRAVARATDPAAPARAATTGRREVDARAQRETAGDASPDAAPLRGCVAAGGIAIGIAARLRAPVVDAAPASGTPRDERAALDRARERVRARLRQRATNGGAVDGAIAAAHLALLDDAALVPAANEAVAAGRSAGEAWRDVLRNAADALARLEDPRLAERATDLRDLEARVLLELESERTGAPPRTLAALPPDAIVVAEDLTPSQFAELDLARVAAVCLAAGGPTSHVALLAAAAGVPMLTNVGTALLAIADGTPLLADADAGTLTVAPDASARAAAYARRERVRAVDLAERGDERAACRTLDGTRVEVLANVGSVADARLAAANGAEGCGLLRTEFLFLERPTAPDVREQAAEYQAIADALPAGPLVIRTLDAGGDKPLPYVATPREENPALGLRGVRTSLRHPELLDVQLRGILALRSPARVRVLVPMVTEAAELHAVRTVLDRLCREAGLATPPSLGAMIETPSSALLADRIVRAADFVSIGTNDLTQYVLAIDRGHGELAARLDGLHPAVLKAIAAVADAAAAQQRPVAVCGGLAGDVAAVPVLVGLGVRELSVVPALVPRVRAAVRGTSIDRCRELARAALACESAAEVRALVAPHARAATAPEEVLT